MKRAGLFLAIGMMATGVAYGGQLAEPAAMRQQRAPAHQVDEVAGTGEGSSSLFGDAGQVPLPPPRHGRFKFLQQVGSDFKHLPSRDSLYWLAGGGATALAVHPEDNDMNRRLIPHEGFFNPGQTIGSVYVQAGSALLTYVVGRTTRHERVKHLGTDMLSAQIVAQALTQALN